MNVDVAIERLVLDGFDVGAGDRAPLRAAVEGELGRLLAAEGIGPELRGGGAVPSVRAATMAAADPSPVALGAQIARAVHGALAR